MWQIAVNFATHLSYFPTLDSVFRVLPEWRVPHLYPVLHQLPTVRALSVFISETLPYLSNCGPIMSSSPHTAFPASHIAPLCTSIKALPFCPPWQPDMLYGELLSRSRSVYCQLCLRVPVLPFLLCAPIFFSPPLFCTSSFHADRQAIKTVTLSYLMLLMFYSAQSEQCGLLEGVISGIIVSVCTLCDERRLYIYIKVTWNSLYLQCLIRQSLLRTVGSSWLH